MNIDITARKFELTPAIRAHVEEKVSHLDKFFEKIGQVRVVLEVDDGHHRHGNVYGCEITLNLPEKAFLIGRAWTDDMHKSVNQSVLKVEDEIRTYKGKHLKIDQEIIRETKIDPLAKEEVEEE